MADQAAAGPSTANIALGTAIISLVCGYFLGQGQSIGLFGVGSSSGGPSLTRGSGHMSRDDELSGEDDDDQQQLSSDEDDYDVGELSTEFADPTEECKLVLVVRSDLGMGKGKIAAQCSHATLACYKAITKQSQSSPTSSSIHPYLKRWESQGQAKIALKLDAAEGEEELLLLQAQAISLGLCAQVIRDAGRTQIASGSATVLGVGPAPKGSIDRVTGHLKLL